MNSEFTIGQKAVYPAHGVAEVIGIESKEINTTVLCNHAPSQGFGI